MLDDALGQWGETHGIFKVLKAQEFLVRSMVHCAALEALECVVKKRSAGLSEKIYSGLARELKD
jgi:hypothetical protein